MYLGFMYEALRHLAAGVGAVATSTNPLFLALAAPWLLGERLTAKKSLGLLLGFAGVLAIMWERQGSGTAEPRDVLLTMFAVFASVASTIVYKKFLVQLDVRMTTALQLCAASIVLIPFAIVTGRRAAHDLGHADRHFVRVSRGGDERRRVAAVVLAAGTRRSQPRHRVLLSSRRCSVS